MSSLLVKVRKKMSITAHRKVRTALEGEYGSIFKGRSMDFDDLREYTPGDDIKDIDWKATARSGQVLIKRYVAIRKQNILLVVDTGRDMAATAESGESKKDIAVLAAGVIAYVAQKHGDLMGLVAGDSQNIKYMPLKGDTSHIERILQYIDSRTTLNSPKSDLGNLLNYIARTIDRHMMLIVISDNLTFDEEQIRVFRRLAAQHEIMFIGIDDLNPCDEQWSSKDLYDVDRSFASFPLFLRNSKVSKSYSSLLKEDWAKAKHDLDQIRIGNIRLGSESSVVPQIVRLLEKQRRVRR